MTRHRIAHHFTVDVEESFHASAMEPYVPRTSWHTRTSRVAIGTERLLEILAEHQVTGTFFVLGWVANRDPAIVRMIAAAGHEIASHGWGHERVTHLRPAQFRASVRDAKAVLEEHSGAPVLGYRAPSFSIVRGGEWALDVLLEEGYRYDSSLYPVARRGYGYAGGMRDPYVITRAGGVLQEFPPATLRVGATLLPAGGGAYFRHLPYALVDQAVRSAERRRAQATFYIHPWELDPDQERIPTPHLTRLRHYGGMTRTLPRLWRLLSRHRFQSIARTMAGWGHVATPAPTPSPRSASA